MRVSEMNWMQVEAQARVDDRAILPLGSTEQHAYLSLATDSILAERLALEAAEPLGVPVFPVLPYGMAPYFRSYPGTVSLRPDTYAALVGDLLDSLVAGGFRRILLVNGHGGNTPVSALLAEWGSRQPGVRLRLHDWWRSPKVWAAVQAADPVASHASWMENFPWTRLPGVELPGEPKPPVDAERLRQLSAEELRPVLGDGNYAGLYQRPDEEMLRIWQVAVDEVRRLLEDGWAA